MSIKALRRTVIAAVPLLGLFVLANASAPGEAGPARTDKSATFIHHMDLSGTAPSVQQPVDA